MIEWTEPETGHRYRVDGDTLYWLPPGKDQAPIAVDPDGEDGVALLRHTVRMADGIKRAVVLAAERWPELRDLQAILGPLIAPPPIPH